MSDDPIGVDDLQVSGGSGGTSANLDDLRVLASTSGDLAGQIGSISASTHAILFDADWIASALLSPGTAAAASGVLLDALDGPAGLTWLAAEMEVRSTVVTKVANAYEAADEAQAAAMNLWEWFEGASGITAAQLVWAGIDIWQSGDAERWITDHPEFIDDTINSAPGLLVYTGILWPPAAAALNGMFGPGVFFSKHAVMSAASSFFPIGDQATVTARSAGDGIDTKLNDDAAHQFAPPAGISDLITNLNYRNGQADADSDIIDVEIVTQPDGSQGAIVNIPGTKGGLTPLEAGASTNDFNTNLHVLAGETTDRELAIARAVQQALAQAGADPDTPVMLVGHSQGGMVAAQAAADSQALGINITHVVTAGSPIALADIPSDVQVLSLENHNDIVPHLDGADNPGASNITTVTFDNQEGTINANHSIDPHHGYAEAAAAVDQSDDPSLASFQAGADVFFDYGEGAHVDVQAYEIDRVP